MALIAWPKLLFPVAVLGTFIRVADAQDRRHGLPGAPSESNRPVPASSLLIPDGTARAALPTMNRRSRSQKYSITAVTGCPALPPRIPSIFFAIVASR
jgi:hypothetical protein